MVVYPVEIDKRYSKDFQAREEFRVPWQKVLSSARSRDAAVKCCCPGSGGKRLSVRYYEDSDSCGLARYPLTGEEHSNDCRFYAPNPEKSGLAGYEKGVVDELDNGGVKIRLGIGLRKKQPSDNPNTLQPPVQRGPTGKQARMTLLGLLHYLWDRAGLNVWWPAMQGKRDSGLVNARLREAASDIKVGQIKLDRVLLLSALAKEGRWALLNQERVLEANQGGLRLLMIAPLASYRREREMNALPIKGYGGLPFLDVDAQLWDAVRNRYHRAVAAWQQGSSVITIAQLEVKGNVRYARVLDVALMSVTDNWIPVDSSYEKRIADKLTLEKRAFLKPMRFDAEEDEVFPDFILRDTGCDIPLEVFGRSDEAYEARRLSKERYYAEKFKVTGWWCWDAATDPDGLTIKPFPQSLRK